MKEERLAILRMLENGTISVDEAERLLNAVKETGDKMDFSESLNTFFSKTGDVLEKAGQKVKSAAKTAGEKAEVAKPEIIKAAKVVKEKVGETADSIMEDIKRRRAESGDGDVFEGEYKEKTDEPENQEGKTEEQTESTVDKAVHAEDFNEELREAEFNKMMGQAGEEASGVSDTAEEDPMLRAQREWEEMKKSDDNGEVR